MGNPSEKIGRDGNNTPDLFDIWKAVYYQTEKSWADIVKKTITTESYAKNMMQWMNFYLDFEKMFRKGMDRYFESAPVPSKKDIARVAKLVINVEDKVDNLETNMEKNLHRLVDSLDVLVEKISCKQGKQTATDNKINRLEEALESINRQLSELSDKMDRLAGQHSVAGAAVKKSPSKQGQSKGGKGKSETATAENKAEEIKQEDASGEETTR